MVICSYCGKPVEQKGRGRTRLRHQECINRQRSETRRIAGLLAGDTESAYHMTLEEIGRHLGVTKARAHQILKDALANFRHNYIRMFGDPADIIQDL